MLLDLDGTLYRSDSFHAANRDTAVLAIAAHRAIGKREAERLLNAAYGASREEKGFEPSLSSVVLEQIGVKLEQWIRIKRDYPWPFDEIHRDDELRRKLETLGRRCTIAVVTNNSRDPTTEMLRRLGVENVLRQHVFTIEDLARPKPNRESLERVISRLDLRPWEVMFVGDRIYVDLAPALDLGMFAMLIHGSQSIVERLGQLADFLG